MAKIAVVGGGILGVTLTLRLAQQGHEVSLLERAPSLGGLADPAGQLRPQQSIQFERISPQTAASLIREQERWMQEISAA